MEYVVLKSKTPFVSLEDIPEPRPAGPSPSGRRAGPFAVRTAGRRGRYVRSGGQAAPLEVSVESQDLSRQEAMRMEEEGALAVAPKFKTKLIKPMDRSTPADLSGGLWGLEALGVSGVGYQGEGVTVAVIDTGINKDHVAFDHMPGRIETRDFTNSSDTDTDGHGTHCAGTIFGGTVGGRQIGVAPGIEKALIAKVFSDEGGGDTGMLTAAILWAMQEGADVISMSLGFDFVAQADWYERQGGYSYDASISLALDSYREVAEFFDRISSLGDLVDPTQSSKGTVICAAAGNENNQSGGTLTDIRASLPAAASGIVSVGALSPGTGSGFEVANFSNSMPDLGAPGVDILSAAHDSNEGLVAMSGTSMATPHVAGAAALWWDYLRRHNRRVDAEMVKSNLTVRATRTGLAPGVDQDDVGTGLVTLPV